MNIILDANFLLLPGQMKADIFAEIERVIDVKFKIKTLQAVVDELEEISAKGSKDGRAAKLGLLLIEKKRVDVLKIKGVADEEIYKYASKNPCIVATQDRKLRQKLLNIDTPVIYLRGRKTLTFLGYLP